MSKLLSLKHTEREVHIEAMINGERVLYGSGFPFDEERARTYASNSYDRCFYPQGIARHIVVTSTNSDRKPKLTSVTVPTLVVHGSEDPRVPVEGGKDTAAAIPGAKLLIIDGIG